MAETMKKYRVRLEFRYVDTVEVEAESEKEAERLALNESDEKFDSYLDCSITELKP